jgi:hypothetical protein
MPERHWRDLIYNIQTPLSSMFEHTLKLFFVEDPSNEVAFVLRTLAQPCDLAIKSIFFYTKHIYKAKLFYISNIITTYEIFQFQKNGPSRKRHGLRK